MFLLKQTLNTFWMRGLEITVHASGERVSKINRFLAIYFFKVIMFCYEAVFKAIVSYQACRPCVETCVL